MRKLIAWAQTVNQLMSIGLLSSGLVDDVVPERIGEDQDHRDHETVDGDGFDHRQADEQGSRDGARGIGLLHREVRAVETAFPSPIAGAMLPSPMVIPAVMIETIAIIVMLSIGVLSSLMVEVHASRVRVAAAM